jgi:hypothetical protein
MPDPSDSTSSTPVSPLPQPSTEGEGRDEQSPVAEIVALALCDHVTGLGSVMAATNAVLDALGLEQVGWNSATHGLHYHEDGPGVLPCEPVYRLGVAR